MQTDLEKARELLAGDSSLSCVLVRDSRVYRSRERGVAPLLGFLERGEDLSGFSLADKVIGRAAAFLVLELRLKTLWTAVLSDAAASLLEEHRFPFLCDTRTPAIRNRSNTGPCPMEAAVQGIELSTDALRAIRETLKALKSSK